MIVYPKINETNERENDFYPPDHGNGRNDDRTSPVTSASTYAGNRNGRDKGGKAAKAQATA